MRRQGKGFASAVFILLPIGRSSFQQLQPRHASDYSIGVKDRVDERIGREGYAVLEAGNGRRAPPGPQFEPASDTTSFPPATGESEPVLALSDV